MTSTKSASGIKNDLVNRARKILNKASRRPIHELTPKKQWQLFRLLLRARSLHDDAWGQKKTTELRKAIVHKTVWFAVILVLETTLSMLSILLIAFFLRACVIFPSPTFPPTPTLTPVSTPGLCAGLDVNTFTLGDGVSTKTITANTTYSTTLVNGKLPELIITANVTARPSGCQQQLTYQWTRYDSTGSLALSNFQDFHNIDQPSPPMGQVEMIRVFVEDKVTRAQVSAYLNLSSINPEESKGATP
jgi:hypothetical protein